MSPSKLLKMGIDSAITMEMAQVAKVMPNHAKLESFVRRTMCLVLRKSLEKM